MAHGLLVFQEFLHRPHHHKGPVVGMDGGIIDSRLLTTSDSPYEQAATVSGTTVKGNRFTSACLPNYNFPVPFSLGYALGIGYGHVPCRGNHGIARVGHGDGRNFILEKINGQVHSEHTRQDILSILTLMENGNSIYGNGFRHEFPYEGFLPTACLAVPGTVIPFLVLVVGSCHQADFVFGKSGKAHKFSLGSLRPHSRLVGQHYSHNLRNQVTGIGEGMQQERVQLRLGHLALAEDSRNIVTHQFSRIEKLINVVDISTASLFAALVGHPIQHILSLVAHDAKDYAKNDGDRRQNHQRLLKRQSPPVKTHKIPAYCL